MRIFHLGILLFLLSVSIAGCSASRLPHSGLVDRMKNRGPVPLSADNPYLAGNLLLAKEMEHSAEVKGFVEHRGTPGAIEISHELFEEPSMRFYYPENGEFFSFEYVDNTWLIEGPLTISPEKQRELKRASAGGKAPLPPPSPIGTPSAAPAPIVTPLPTASPLAKGGEPFRSPSIQATPEPSPTAFPTQDNTRIKSLIETAPKNEAEISPKGDLVHYVTFPGETLEVISEWYTLDVSNSGRLARLNKIKTGESLSQGDTIIVPSYFVRNKIRLTEQAIGALKSAETLGDFKAKTVPADEGSRNDRRY